MDDHAAPPERAVTLPRARRRRIGRLLQWAGGASPPLRRADLERDRDRLLRSLAVPDLDVGAGLERVRGVGRVALDRKRLLERRLPVALRQLAVDQEVHALDLDELRALLGALLERQRRGERL